MRQTTSRPALIWRQVQPIRSISFPLADRLSLSGVRFRHRLQMPVVTGAQDTTVRAVVGSVRGLAIRNGELCGNLRWTSDPAAQIVRQKFEDGHLELRLDVQELEAGPKNTVRRWAPIAAVLVANGE